jgi:hypothetical protein
MEYNCKTALTLCVITSLFFTDTAFVVHQPLASWASRGLIRRFRQLSPRKKTAKCNVPSWVALHFQNGGEDAFGDRSNSPPPVMLYGESRETWSFHDQTVEGVQIVLKNEGYPVHAELDVWEGPYYTPQRMQMYSENGQLYPFCAIIETPNGQHAIGISNNGKLMDRGQIADPIIAGVKADNSVGPTSDTKPDLIEGGSVQSFTFPPSVSSVRILLQTEGFPMDAKVELLQGDNEEVKQVVDVFSEDGMKNPLFTMMSTPGKKSTIRVQNRGSPHFPGIIACVEPYLIDVDDSSNSEDDTKTKEHTQESTIEHVKTELVVEDEAVQRTPYMREPEAPSFYSQMYDQPGHPSFADMYGHAPHPLDNGMFAPPGYFSVNGVYEYHPPQAPMYVSHRSALETEMYDSARARFEEDVARQSIYDNAPPPMYEDLMYDDTYAHIYDSPVREPEYNKQQEDEDRRFSKKPAQVQDATYERVHRTDIQDESPPAPTNQPATEPVGVDVITSLFRQFWE